MSRYVLSLQDLDQTQAGLVGGKGAQLGELSRIDGIRVPAGLCVTTDAFQRVMAQTSSIGDLLDALSRLTSNERDAVRALSAEVRQAIEALAVPEDVAAAITAAVAELGEDGAYAVRSSATTEDSPTASFAGQQDTYLNVIGSAAVLEHVRHCWASLFTERAVTYRLRNGFDHRKAHMAVVVQRMVFAKAAGILFTADPVSGNRKTASVEASFGLGEALVSGLVNADVYKVRNHQILARTLGTKQRTIIASPLGGTHQQEVGTGHQQQPALTDTQVVQLVRLGGRIEAHFGRPQDIEWCLDDDGFQFVQSRPITTLFPVPRATDDENHVYVSVGHGQMMTDAMKPLAVSIRQLTGIATFHEAGGRLWVDVTRGLASPAARAGLLDVFGKSDPLLRDALETILERGDFVPVLPNKVPSGAPAAAPPSPIETDRAIVAALIERNEASVATLEHEVRDKSGAALLDFIQADFAELKRLLSEPHSHQAVMAGMEASWWLNDHLYSWLGEKNAADVLTQSVPNNVTSEMGLALLDVADVIRPHLEVVAFLQDVHDEGFLNDLPSLEGGAEARAAIRAWLDKYGMRCIGEVDITRPRWSECPSTLVPMILGNIKNFEPGAAKRRFDQGRAQAWEKEQELLQRLRTVPNGEEKGTDVKRMIDRVRTFIGYREYPKYGMIRRYFIYKRALLEEADRLVKAGVLRTKDDIFYLTFPEIQDVVRTNRVDNQLIDQRKDAFRSYETLTVPRVLTSDGDALSGKYRRNDIPAGALVGLAVSAGTVEGRARVVLDAADADLEPGDILVTPFTDPSWTPLFVAIGGMVTEVGGLMTHGAVIAREYGLPAVVGVERATQRIQNGQRIRVNGTDGYVEILS